MDLSERQLKILQAIITDYVENAEPVGSRSIAKKYDLGVSPATIRNEMSDLEEMGYLTHPHTSAGRVPSDKAYRLYVNNLMKKKNLSARDKRMINDRLSASRDEFDRTIRHAAELLSEITNLASFAMTPATNEETISFIRLLPVDDRTLILMIVGESGNITNTTLRLKVPYTQEALDLLSKNMTVRHKGRTLDDVLGCRFGYRGDELSRRRRDAEFHQDPRRNAQCQSVHGGHDQHIRSSGVLEHRQGKGFHGTLRQKGLVHPEDACQG